MFVYVSFIVPVICAFVCRCYFLLILFFFFFKQKTAYEMRISDWSSDVCSSDLQGATHMAEGYARSTGKPGVVLVTSGPGATNAVTGITDALKIGRASCRERVCQYV